MELVHLQARPPRALRICGIRRGCRAFLYYVRSLFNFQSRYGFCLESFCLFRMLTGAVLGPLLLGPLFDSIGRKPMIAFTYAVSGLLLAWLRTPEERMWPWGTPNALPPATGCSRQGSAPLPRGPIDSSPMSSPTSPAGASSPLARRGATTGARVSTMDLALRQNTSARHFRRVSTVA
jgi:hypothetical protein